MIVSIELLFSFQLVVVREVSFCESYELIKVHIFIYSFH
jgi:hypothetical protein